MLLGLHKDVSLFLQELWLFFYTVGIWVLLVHKKGYLLPNERFYILAFDYQAIGGVILIFAPHSLLAGEHQGV